MVPKTGYVWSPLPLTKPEARRCVAVFARDRLRALGDNPRRLTSDRSFAALCGASPIEASSGKTRRQRLNRGGDRHANSTLHRIVITRLRCDPRTRAYQQRRLAEGKTPREIVRCLKRYVAREIYNAIPRTSPPAAAAT